MSAQAITGEAAELLTGCPDAEVAAEVAGELLAAAARVAELIAADRELDAAQDEMAAAKREKGNWRVNPLRFNHPAVLRVQAARARRRDALNNIEGISA